MTTPPYAELVAFVRSEGEAIVSASRQGVDAPVPTCGDWTVADLCRHVGRVYGRVAHIVSERLTAETDYWPEASGDPVDWVAESLDDLVAALGGCDADTPVWNWSGSAPHVTSFWARRMAHESAVHRFDAQRAHGVAQPVDADLAGDGLDELVDVLLPRIIARDALSPQAATYVFASVEDGAWRVRTDEGGVSRIDADAVPDVTTRGTTSALLLAAYNRVPWTSLEVVGDSDALDAWSRTFRF
ncbi:MAG: hypothetical protein QOD07_2759 [Frankiaceae bacterium]|jgi:uncharacterized protein (TIGR03083 family)|nr:hypothetical protein [Frankiaceae bacterium]